jgi:hypothetical protein
MIIMNEQFPNLAPPAAERSRFIKLLIGKLSRIRESDDAARTEGESWYQHVFDSMQQITPSYYNAELRSNLGEEKLKILKDTSDAIFKELEVIKAEYAKAPTDQVPEEVRERIYSKVDEINQLFA